VLFPLQLFIVILFVFHQFRLHVDAYYLLSGGSRNLRMGGGGGVTTNYKHIERVECIILII